jgi:hypothetical protein
MSFEHGIESCNKLYSNLNAYAGFSGLGTYQTLKIKIKNQSLVMDLYSYIA